jgi:TRAP-type uncharacterized transport system substrate-binding protein
VGLCVAGALIVALIALFLAPDLSYQVKDRLAEMFSKRHDRPFRMALGVKRGSFFRLGTTLNRYLRETAGYEFELVETEGPSQTVRDLLDPAKQIDVATIESSSEAANAAGLFGLAAVGRQYLFVIVAADSPLTDFRDLTGRVDPGSRAQGQLATLGERVLEYYGLVDGEGAASGTAAVTVVRPTGSMSFNERFAGGLTAVTRTQFLHSDLTDPMLNSGRYRLLPIRDHNALAQWLPGTTAAFIPAGAYGPGRRIPAEPTPTLSMTTMILTRSDLPARVVRDLLDVIYDPRFARDIQQDVTEDVGRKVGALPLHPAAEIYYRRNDSVTSDRIGRVSFVVTGIAAIFTAGQFLSRFRRNERRKARRRLLSSELEKLDAIRNRIEESDGPTARALVAEADDLLSHAEQDAAAELLDAEGIQSLRSLHGICWRALQHRQSAVITGVTGETRAPTT